MSKGAFILEEIFPRTTCDYSIAVFSNSVASILDFVYNHGVDWDLIAHNWAVDILAREIATGTIRQAYMFTGLAGLGRRTLALRFTQALNCPTPPSPGDACRNCRTCRQIEQMAFSDLSIVEAQLSGGTLRVDQVREMLHKLALKPYEAKYRVAVLLRFEEAHPSAMNALLKTLEEPAPQVVMIITAESAESLLPTITSRCEILRLRPLAVAELSAHLQMKKDLPADLADLCAHLSAGRPGVALRLAQNPDILENRKKWLEFHQHVLVSSLRERFSLVEDLLKEGESLKEGLTIWTSLWRDVVLTSLNASVPVVNTDLQGEISRLTTQFGERVSIKKISLLEKTITLLEKNINPKLALEVLLLDLPYND